MTSASIMLASGSLMDLRKPSASAFTIGDIALGLSRICRFAGQTSRFYSVAEHCIHVARLVPLAHARAALLHDASEAFIGDVTRPLKALLPAYREIERGIEEAIAGRFLIDQATDAMRHPIDMLHDPVIKRMDQAICVVEARQMMPCVRGYWSGIDADPDAVTAARQTQFNYYGPDQAAAAWLRAWNRYSHIVDQIDARENA